MFPLENSHQKRIPNQKPHTHVGLGGLNLQLSGAKSSQRPETDSARRCKNHPDGECSGPRASKVQLVGFLARHRSKQLAIGESSTRGRSFNCLSASCETGHVGVSLRGAGFLGDTYQGLLGFLGDTGKLGSRCPTRPFQICRVAREVFGFHPGVPFTRGHVVPTGEGRGTFGVVWGLEFRA